MSPLETLSGSRALWNRERFDLESEEALSERRSHLLNLSGYTSNG